jgi:phosphatidylserine/phosphatidylglycerophosphate/cardiolipin synthase-like enzyme/DNA/RNA endonuclease YhcR with UshA esterase domain
MKQLTFTAIIAILMAFSTNTVFAQANIAAARTYAQGQTVTITGVVINGGTLGPIRYVQDATAGLAVYDPAVTNTWNIGDNVTVTGTMGIFNGLIQVVSTTSHTVNSTGNALPAPSVVTPSGVNLSNESQLVQVNMVSFANGGGTFGNGTISVSANGQSTLMYLRAGHPLIGTTIPLNPVNIVGVSSQFNGTPQLLPREISDITTATPFYFTSPPVQTNLAQTGFTLSWETSQAASTKVYYGTDPLFLSQTLDLGGSTTTHTANLAGLSAGTIFYAMAVSENTFGTISSPVTPYATVSSSSGLIEIHFNGVVDNSISTGVDANHAIPAHLEEKIIEKINNAVNTIEIAAYNINRSPIVQALNAAVNRGVTVRMVTYSGSANLALQNVPPLFSVLPGNANGLMHNKFIIIDRNTANKALVITGSMNFTEQNLLDDFNNVIFIYDQSLARAYNLEFNEMWGGTGATPGIFAAVFGNLKTKNTPTKFVVGGVPMELYFSPSDGTTSAISKALQTTDADLEFALLTFTRDDLRDDVLAAYNDGAQVRGIIENTNDQGGEYQTLLSAGISVQSHPASGQIHHKYAIIDEADPTSDPIVITGSHNWSSSAETSNDENTLIIHDATIANIFAQEFNARWLGMTTGTKTLTNLAGFKTSIAPNPAQTTALLTIESDNFEETTVTIIASNGAIIRTFRLNNLQGTTTHQLDVSDLPQGVYFVTFKIGEVLTFEKIFVTK